jgi:hypothetical protein
VGSATIRRIERSKRVTGHASTLVRLEEAFEKAGILFIDDEEEGGYGLRLAKKKRGR